MENNNIINGNCWITYFDILGFKEKVLAFERGFDYGRLDFFVQNFYGKLIDKQKKHCEYQPDRVFITWFSDTFLFYTRNDSKDSFAHIARIAKSFCQVTMSKNWPFRAAIGFGQLYADKLNNIFLGSGLIDAYEYAEKQNWIGLVVTPKANNRLRELSVELQRRPVMFKEYDVPLKRKKIKNSICVSVEETELLFAVSIHELSNVRRYVKQMQDEAMRRDPRGYEDSYKKYENTLKFFEETK